MLEQPSNMPLHMLQSGQFMMLAPEGNGWLILQKPFYAEIVGPGAMVGGSFDVQSQSIYAIGNVHFVETSSEEQRQAAFQKRVEYIQSMQPILLEGSPIKRASLLIEQLVSWIGSGATQEIPHELLSRLGGVLPHNIALGWRVVSRDALPDRELASVS
jgi:hypothetical protein